MKAKLIKDEDGYSLFTREENSTNRKFIATTQGMYVDHKISKQNCDELFGVVNVEKLAEESVFDGFRTIWKNGFNKAMELNKDKLFTVEELRYAFYTGMKHGSEGGIMFGKALADEYVQSLQQPTEIEVEIEMECLDPNCDGINKKGVCIPGDKPKLDSEGCLIIKKI
jgi:hypothetical protein